VGEKMIYPNWEWSSQENLCVIVEGQADAITIAQWGLPAVALCGVHADDHLARFLGVGDDRRQVNFAIGLDADQAGTKNTKELANLFGPMTRMITWRGIGGIDTFIDPIDGQEHDVKDANDLLRGMLK
jgi:DNA primase